MGIFTVDVDIAPPRSPDAFHPCGRLIVDTGSEVSWVRSGLLRELGIAIQKPQVGFQMANGDAIYRDVGFAVLRAQGFFTIDEVVFAEDGDLELLGARTLEGFNARIDPVTKRLMPAGPIIAAQNRRG